MSKYVFVGSAGATTLAFVILVTFMIVMMSGATGGMMGGMGGMMGRSGSDPADEPAVGGVTQVRQQDFAFAPANIVVDVATTVTWTNRDGVAHTSNERRRQRISEPAARPGRDVQPHLRRARSVPLLLRATPLHEGPGHG